MDNFTTLSMKYPLKSGIHKYINGLIGANCWYVMFKRRCSKKRFRTKELAKAYYEGLKDGWMVK